MKNFLYKNKLILSLCATAAVAATWVGGCPRCGGGFFG